MMRSESPYTDNAGRPIRERDTIEAKYGYRYTVCLDPARDGWTAVDSTGHNRIALERVARFCTVADRAWEGS
ncbi:MAG: hypothetical protein KBA15_08970 [Spirochaetes bacterium]|jgi:hypothetical protein|nr:hypothetical protein [Spirochaetota bacterium]